MKFAKVKVLGLAIIASGLMLVPVCPACAQRMGSMGGSPQGPMGGQPGANNPGMPGSNPNGMTGQQNMMQVNMEQHFLGTLRRNSKAETELSKLAVKNSSNDAVKKMAQDVIQQNHKTDSSITASLSSAAPGGAMGMMTDIPSQTKKALKQMKKLTGNPFDMMYMSQMDGYIKSDQKLTSDASTQLDSTDMRAMTMQLRTVADNRAQQLAQVAQSENVKIQ